MPPTRKSPPPHRKRDSQRLLKLRTGNGPSRTAGERRHRVPHEEIEALRPKRPEPTPVGGVVEVVTADLTRDPRHEK